jgi:glycosyltransferase 2 family protein
MRIKRAMWRLRPALGYLLAAAGLAWALTDIEFGKLPGYLININWWWVALAMVCDILSYTCQGLRWGLLLRPLSKVSTLRSTQAIYAGLFTNEVLPMRLGELVRAYLVSRWVGANFLAVIPSMVVERLIDGVWLAVIFALTTIFVSFPVGLLRAGETLGLIVVIAATLFLYLVFSQGRASNERARGAIWAWRPARVVVSTMNRLTDGLRGIGSTRLFFFAFTLSSVSLLLQALAFWLMMVGYGLRLSFRVGVAVFLIVQVGTLIPNAPANVGAYQFFCVVGLKLFGVEKTMAMGFSVVVFILLTLPLLIIGFVALSRSGTTLLKIREEMKSTRI